MRFLVNSSTDPYFNMAYDEYCLTRLGAEEPLFYLWRNRPSVIIGLNQNAYGEVNLEYLRSRGISLARRVTGGGAVYHDLQNLNYSIIGRKVSPEPIVGALRSLGVDAELSGRNDIFVGGRKVSGYARRVWQDRELVHGTLMYDVDLDTLGAALCVPGSKLETKGIASVRSRVANLRDCLPGLASITDFAAAMQSLLACGDGGAELEKSAVAEIEKLAEEKFASWEWIYGHSREASLQRSARLACGTVTAGISLDRGLIRSVEFGGDFIGDLPADFVAERLRGVRFEHQSILSALENCEIGKAFAGTTPAELAGLLAG